MKAKGIASSKRRLATLQRTQARDNARRDVLKAPDLMRGHRPTPREDGALCCSGCYGQPFSPAAFALHLTGAPMLDMHQGAWTTGAFDPWTEAKEKQRAGVAEGDSGEEKALREQQIAAFYDRRGGKARAVDTQVGTFFD